MVTRSLPSNYEKPKYVEGFLHNQFKEMNAIDYGYSQNHMPETSKKNVTIASSYDLAISNGLSR
jgi:hypothetical protein